MATTAEKVGRTLEQQEAMRLSNERDFYNRIAEGYLVEAFGENFGGDRAARQAVIDAMRQRDALELLRLFCEHVEPYLDYQLEGER